MSTAKCTRQRLKLNNFSLGFLSFLYCRSASLILCPVSWFFNSIVSKGMPFKNSPISTDSSEFDEKCNALAEKLGLKEFNKRAEKCQF